MSNNVIDFIAWVLRQAKRTYVPSEGAYVIPASEIGSIRRMEYLMGGMVAPVTANMLEYRWDTFYSKNGWTRAQYDSITKDWVANGVWVSDCGGLFDGYKTQVLGEKTDYNVPMLIQYEGLNYKAVGSWDDLPIGKTVFVVNPTTGNANHVGWICGHMPDGEPLIVEARGLAYGVIISQWTKRNFSRCCDLRTFTDSESEDGGENVVEFEFVQPMKTGEAYLQMQKTLNMCGYLDYEDKQLDLDGKWGRRSQTAFDRLLAAHNQMAVDVEELTITLGGDIVNTYKVVKTNE